MSMTMLPWPNDARDDDPDQPWNYGCSNDDRTVAKRKAEWLDEIGQPVHRRLNVIDVFEVTGRGAVYVVTDPDPILEIGEEIEVTVTLRGAVQGLERHAIEPRPGRAVGVQFRAKSIVGA